MVDPERIESWFNLADLCMRDAPEWKLNAAQAEASLSHLSMSWGILMKFDMRNIWIPEAPEDPADLLTRPEVRGRNYHIAPSASKVTLLEVLAPGDALVEHQPLSAWLVRLLAKVLFGNSDSEGPFPSTPRSHWNIARHQLRRDYPLPGDCTYGEFHAETNQECILVCRKEGDGLSTGACNRFRVVIAFPVPIGSNLPGAWASPFYPMMLDLVRQAACDFLNRPGLPALTKIDMQAYVVLSLRNYNRGAPLVPHKGGAGKEVITISSGQESGFSSWTRFRSQSQQFRFAQYMQVFMEKLGHPLKTYETLDGRVLVPYQCVVSRQEWEKLRDVFAPVFGKQKAAYRRANGGASAPNWTDTLRPHFLSKQPQWLQPPPDAVTTNADESNAVNLVVRNTFLELQEAGLPASSTCRRSKSIDAGRSSRK